MMKRIKEEDIHLSEESMDVLNKLMCHGQMVLLRPDSEPLTIYGLVSRAGDMRYYDNGEVHLGTMWAISTRGKKLLTVDDKYVKKYLILWARMDGLLDEE
jgi:hypothetical protein